MSEGMMFGHNIKGVTFTIYEEEEKIRTINLPLNGNTKLGAPWLCSELSNVQMKEIITMFKEAMEIQGA